MFRPTTREKALNTCAFGVRRKVAACWACAPTQPNVSSSSSGTEFDTASIQGRLPTAGRCSSGSGRTTRWGNSGERTGAGSCTSTATWRMTFWLGKLAEFWDWLAVAAKSMEVLMGDFNMSLFLVIPALRRRGVTIDLAAWFPYKQPDCTPHSGLVCYLLHQPTRPLPAQQGA